MTVLTLEPFANSLASSLALNAPDALAQLNAAFDAYEDALVQNKVSVLDELFWTHPLTLRFGAKENLFGADQIKAFRASRPSVGLSREIIDRHIVTFGDTMGVANITFKRPGEPRIGRQSQTWVKFDAGWRVVSAHVSWMDP